ncbi:hypothetical protein [Neptuniibacter halophilus]|uniref:hypothetical protein n=1 Tax=Neptuniibacter halophilus TaxID=651666 RepID=UPI002572863F|nr:hypothetical protein [Neptuniibacter halophilus]
MQVLKRKLTIHMDAALMMGALFVVSIAINVLLLQQNQELSDTNYRQSIKLIENDMNLSSQQNYIEKLNRECKDKPAE